MQTSCDGATNSGTSTPLWDSQLSCATAPKRWEHPVNDSGSFSGAAALASGDSDDRSLLIPCCSLPGETQSVLAQRTIGPKWYQNILRDAYQKASQVSVSAFRNP